MPDTGASRKRPISGRRIPGCLMAPGRLIEAPQPILQAAVNKMSRPRLRSRSREVADSAVLPFCGFRRSRSIRLGVPAVSASPSPMGDVGRYPKTPRDPIHPARDALVSVVPARVRGMHFDPEKYGFLRCRDPRCRTCCCGHDPKTERCATSPSLVAKAFAQRRGCTRRFHRRGDSPLLSVVTQIAFAGADSPL